MLRCLTDLGGSRARPVKVLVLGGLGAVGSGLRTCLLRSTACCPVLLCLLCVYCVHLCLLWLCYPVSPVHKALCTPAVAVDRESACVVRRYLPKVSSLSWEFTTVDLPGAEDKVPDKRTPHPPPPPYS